MFIQVTLLGRFLVTNFTFQWLPSFMNWCVTCWFNSAIIWFFPVWVLLNDNFLLYLGIHTSNCLTRSKFMVKCEICDKMFARKYELIKHITIAHEGHFSNVDFARKYEFRKHITIVHDGNLLMWNLWKNIWKKYKLRMRITIANDRKLLNVRFVMKYLKENTNLESILQLFMMGTF